MKVTQISCRKFWKIEFWKIEEKNGIPLFRFYGRHNKRCFLTSILFDSW